MLQNGFLDHQQQQLDNNNNKNYDYTINIHITYYIVGSKKGAYQTVTYLKVRLLTTGLNDAGKFFS